MFGYYIEVRNAHKDKVPPEWIRKQTTVSAERYITGELKEFESKILGAEDRIAQIESRIYSALVETVSRHIAAIQENSRAVAQVDCLLGFAAVADENSYCCPVVDDSTDLEIIEGRHPVIEKKLPVGEPYIPNSITLNRDNQQIIMITGPNMSGKSALLRQTALICLMAQTGSYVPARSGQDRNYRPYIYPRGSVGQPFVGRIDFYGRDERNGQYPEQRIGAESDYTGRDRPRH